MDGGPFSVQSIEKYYGVGKSHHSPRQSSLRNSSGFTECRALGNAQTLRTTTHDSVALEDVVVTFTLEEWALLDPSQKKLYKDVMRKTFKNLASIGKKWDDHDIEELYKSQKRKQQRSHMAEKLSESLIPDVNLNKKTTAVKRHECSTCGKIFLHHSSLNKHIRCHTGHNLCEYQKYSEKPYKFRECDKAFSYHHQSEKPETNHNGKKNYKCKECRETFCIHATLQTHERIHTEEKPYKYKECGRSFPCYQHLIRHMRLHIAEKRYECQQCGKVYRYYPPFQKHERSHSVEKTYECKQCGKNYRHYSSLKIHQQIYTGEKPYRCKQCGKNYRYHSL